MGMQSENGSRCQHGIVTGCAVCELQKLQDALAGYFTGRYPYGTCPDRETAERRLELAGIEAIDRAGRG